jgi:hypothetical protein
MRITKCSKKLQLDCADEKCGHFYLIGTPNCVGIYCLLHEEEAKFPKPLTKRGVRV